MAELLKAATSPSEIWPLVHEQRNKVGDVLETLSAAEWDTPSLCVGWQVRDVAAHLIQTHLVTQRTLISDWIRSALASEPATRVGSIDEGQCLRLTCSACTAKPLAGRATCRASSRTRSSRP